MDFRKLHDADEIDSSCSRRTWCNAMSFVVCKFRGEIPFALYSSSSFSSSALSHALVMTALGAAENVRDIAVD